MILKLPNELAKRIADRASERNMTPEEFVVQELAHFVPTSPFMAREEFSPNGGEARAAPDAADNSTENKDEPASGDSTGKDASEYPPGSLARFAQVARQAGLSTREPVDTSARSREILETEFADYIDRRIRK